MKLHSQRQSPDYGTFVVPVAGGLLAGGVWSSASTDAAAEASTPITPTAVLLVHGITATHLAWPFVAQALLDEGTVTQIIAPDLRGRGRSNQLAPPYRLTQLADDLASVLDHLGVAKVIVVGHSMGAFVAVRLAERHPERVQAVVLVDGGLPIAPPAGVPPEDLAELMLGPALARLAMTFTDRAHYRAFWRAHPAFADDWNETVEEYVDYDLDGTEPFLAASTRPEAVAENAGELDGSAGFAAALAAVRVPVDFIRAPRGLLNQEEALYSPEAVQLAVQSAPGVRTHEARDVNHYTIVMSTHGAEQIVPYITAHSAAARAYGGLSNLQSPRSER